jgi:hypothetical protein
VDLYVFDENGNLITSQVGPGDDCLASWVPKRDRGVHHQGRQSRPDTEP